MPEPMLAAAAVLAGAALILVIVGAVELGLLLLLVMLAVAIVVVAARPRPSAAPSAVRRLAGNARDHVRYAGYSLGSWSRAGKDVFLLRQQLRALDAERQARVYALGEAATDDSSDLVDLRRHVAEIEERRSAVVAQINEVIAGVRKDVERERLTVQPTEIVSHSTDAGTTASEPKDD